MEGKIESIQLVEKDFGYLPCHQKDHTLKESRNTLLARKDARWRMKSQAIWLEAGNKNTLFQKQAKSQKAKNKIWRIQDAKGDSCDSFENICEAATSYIKHSFSQPAKEPISYPLKEDTMLCPKGGIYGLTFQWFE